MKDIAEYAEYIQNEIAAEATSEGLFKEDVFFRFYTDKLIEEGVIRDATRLYYCPSWKSLRIDGYAEVDDDHENVNDLTLFVCDYSSAADVSTLKTSDVKQLFSSLVNFVKEARRPTFRNSLDVDDPGFVAADLIVSKWDQIDGFNLVLLTNRVVGPRLKMPEHQVVESKRIKFDAWDLEKLQRLDTSTGPRVPLVVDFAKLPSGPLPVLQARSNGNEQVYLLVVPGEDLARIYDQWGNRLLEQNVRVFLQARSNVNKGIKATIEHDPQMFLAYNNGITATGTKIQFVPGALGNLVCQIEDLQIVNGGQTTSSIYAAYRNGVDLTNVFVQMKLVVVDPARAATLVPRISEYANSQNKVTGADLMSNQDFQIRMEELSRRIYAPQTQGSTIQTQWFYERARGQYQDEVARRKGSKRKKFKEVCPTNQKITKNNLADYLMAWTDEPWYVALGQAKNVARFTTLIQDEWKGNEDSFDVAYWHMVVAKGVIWKRANLLVRERPWYRAGLYPKVHAAYGIAFFAECLRAIDRELDFEIVWRKQSVPDQLLEVLSISLDIAHEELLRDDRPTTNVQEWAKRPALWERLKERDVSISRAFLESFTIRKADSN